MASLWCHRGDQLGWYFGTWRKWSSVVVKVTLSKRECDLDCLVCAQAVVGSRLGLRDEFGPVLNV